MSTAAAADFGRAVRRPGQGGAVLGDWSRRDDLAGKPGDTVGVEVGAGGKRLLYIPGCARMTDALKRRLAGTSVVLFDGTLWQDDEMSALGLGPKTGRRMGHMSVSGPDGTLAAFRDIPVKRKISSTSTNPTRSCSTIWPSAPASSKEGWEVAYDGMEVSP